MRPLRGLLVLAFLALSGCTLNDNLGSQIYGSEGQPPNVNGACNTGLTVCNNLCTNLQTDVRHCGRCGNACGMGQGCRLGQCNNNPNVDLAVACGSLNQLCCRTDGGTGCD